MRRVNIHRSESDWRKIYDHHQESGLSASRFCSENSIATSSYIKWKRKFDLEATKTVEKLTPVFVEEVKKLELELPGGVKLRLSL